MAKIKWIDTFKVPKVRKRDGATLTHRLKIGLTTEEAIIISDMFEKHKANGEPTISLFRAAILLLAEQDCPPDETLAKALAAVQLRSELAKDLSGPDRDRALALLANSRAGKEKKQASNLSASKPIIVSAPPARRFTREFVPEPRKK